MEEKGGRVTVVLWNWNQIDWIFVNIQVLGYLVSLVKILERTGCGFYSKPPFVYPKNLEKKIVVPAYNIFLLQSNIPQNRGSVPKYHSVYFL